MDERPFINNKDLLKWALDNKIYKWEIKKQQSFTGSDGEIKYETVDGFWSRLVVNKETGERFVYTLTIPSVNCSIIYKDGRDNKNTTITLYHNIFQDFLKQYNTPEEVKRAFENKKGVWETEKFTTCLAF